MNVQAVALENEVGDLLPALYGGLVLRDGDKLLDPVHVLHIAQGGHAVDPSRDYGFVAVAAGEGLKAVFTDLAADAVVSGGQTMNQRLLQMLQKLQLLHFQPASRPLALRHLQVQSL